MEISSLPQTNGAAGVSAATKTGDAAVISSDFETFLVMLTAQIQNQDPLNPVDSSDYAVQLATFSGVEQQVLTNQYLSAMSGDDGTGTSMLDLASWIGLEASTQGAFGFDGAPVDFAFDMPAGTSWAKLVITDAYGREVREIDVANGSSEASWDGVRTDGVTVAAGKYTAQLHTYVAGSETPEVQDVTSFDRIVEIRRGSEAMEVVLNSGQTVAVSDVSALRMPSS